MSTAAVVIPKTGHGPNVGHSTDREPGPRHSLTLVEDVCFECGGSLSESEEHLCAGCSDLAAHAWCRDCGAILADADLEAGACADCTA